MEAVLLVRVVVERVAAAVTFIYSVSVSLSLSLSVSLSLSLAPPVILCLIHDARKIEFIHLLIHSFTRFVYLSLSLPVCLSLCDHISKPLSS